MVATHLSQGFEEIVAADWKRLIFQVTFRWPGAFSTGNMCKWVNNKGSVPKQFRTSTFSKSGAKRHRSQIPHLATLLGNCMCEEHEGRITQLLVLYRCKLAFNILWSCLYLRVHKTATASPLLRHCKFIKPVSAVGTNHVYVCEQILWLCIAIWDIWYIAVGASTSHEAEPCFLLSRWSQTSYMRTVFSFKT